ncbi:hypothetical protein [Nocardioides sp. NPDC006303]
MARSSTQPALQLHEYAEILQRHHMVINEISGNTPVDELIVIATDWGPT